MKKLLRLTTRAILLTVLITLGPGLISQDSALFMTDVVKPETREIDLAKITMESTQVMFNLNKELRQGIPDVELQKLKDRTYSSLNEIDSILQFKQDNYLVTKNIRSLKNLINFWKQKLVEVQNAELKVFNLNKDLDKSRLKYARELAAWNEIRQTATNYNFDEPVMARINQVIQLLDTAILVSGQKSSVTLALLDKSNEIKIEIVKRIDRYDDLLIYKQENIFKSGHPSLFEMDYSNPANWKLREAFLMLHKGEIPALGVYFKNHMNHVIIHLIVLLVIVVVLYLINRSGIPDGKNEDAIYRRSLRVIVSNPGNSAIILVLFASMFIYPNKPPLFTDIFKFAVSIPLAITLINLAHRKYRSTIIAFELLVILQIINTTFPTHLVPTRYFLLLTAILEVYTIVAFLVKIRNARWNRLTLYKIVVILCYIMIFLAAGGFLANMIGKVLLAQSLLNAVTGTALSTILISLAMQVGNGLVMIIIDSSFSDHIHVISRRKDLMKKKVTTLFQIMAGIFMVYFILESFGFEILFTAEMKLFFTRERSLGSATFTWGNIFLFFFVIWVSVYISRWIAIILEEDILDRMGLSKGLPNTISLLVKYTLVTAGFFIAVSIAGLELSKLTIILGAFSVGIGFGLQNIFNNLVSGLILLLERPLKIGDTIEVGSLIGTVKSIGIRASNIETYDGAEIIVPNGNLISNQVINWTLSNKRRRIEVLAGVAYGSDPYRVQQIFMKILEDHPEVVDDPKPIVLFNNLGDSALEFRLLFWTAHFDEWVRIRSEIIFLIYKKLNEEGVQIPFPQRDLHIRYVDPGIEIKRKGK